MVVEMVPLKGARWSYNPYKWPYNWVTGVITPISGVITLLITGRGAHLVGFGRIFYPPRFGKDYKWYIICARV